jgi:hypothetical protein
MIRLTYRLSLVCLLPLAFFFGCGGKYDTQPVRGRVTLTDGTPLPDVRVTFDRESPALTAMGVTDSEGNYSMGTLGPDDGVPPGKYRVAVADVRTADPDRRAPARFHPKHSSYASSGLEYTVTRGRNVFDVKLEAPPKAPRR